MSKPTFTFATEEFLKPQVINCILSNILNITDYNLLDIIVNTRNVTYKYDTLDINILYVDKYLSKGQPMIDLCIYEGILNIDELNQTSPKIIIEITKNDTGDAGNQVYQRIEKFLYAKQHWNQHWDTIIKYMFYTIEIENSRDHQASLISNKILKTLGINISKLIIPKQHYTNISESITPFTTIKNIVDTINSTKSTKGKYINNRIIENDSKIFITSNLIHSKKLKEKSPINDPNTGFVAGLISVIQYIDPTKHIVLTQYCGLYNTQINSNAKLWSCIRTFKDNITIFNNQGIQITKKWDTIADINRHYFKPPQGEKLSSLYLHLYMEKHCNCKLVFHNHAGCERSFIQLNDNYYMPTAKNIPDLCMIDYEKKILYIIEAKQNETKKIKNGISQVQKSEEWAKNNIIKKLDDDFTIEKYLCVYGDSEHPTQHSHFNSDIKLLFSLKSDNSTYFNQDFINRYN